MYKILAKIAIFVLMKKWLSLLLFAFLLVQEACSADGNSVASKGRTPALSSTPDGALVVVYEDDGGLRVCRSRDGGISWQTLPAAKTLRGLGAPCLVADGSDLLLFAVVAPEPGRLCPAGSGKEPFGECCPQGTASPALRLLRSGDGGATWTSETLDLAVPDGIRIVPAPGQGILLQDGTLAAPMVLLDPSIDPRAPSTYNSKTGVQTANAATAGAILTSRDHGRTWTLGDRAKDGTTEGSLAQLPDGRLMLSLADRAMTGRAVYVSDDQGASWTRGTADGMLSDPVCQGSLLAVSAADNCFGSDLLLFCNPCDERDRRHLTLRLSVNGGYNFPFETLIQEAESHGFSCLTMVDPETVGVLYETPEGGLDFRRVSLRELYPGPVFRHIAIPVIPGKMDVPVAELSVAPWDTLPDFTLRIPELPAEALFSYYADRGRVFVQLQDAFVPKSLKSFTLVAEGAGLTVAGDPVHRIARKVRDKGDDGVFSYRIPGLVKTKKGTLVACYDVRYVSGKDMPNDIDVGVSRSTDGGVTWGPMQIAMDMGEWGGRPQKENGIGDPCILLDDVSGDLLLFGTWHHGGRRSAAQEGGFAPDSTGQVMVSRSCDDGRTWSAPVNITRQIKDPSWLSQLEGPGMGITMQDGTLVVPLQFRDSTDVYSATIIYSRDRGQTWRCGLGQIKRYVNEAQIAEIEPGVVMINARDRSISGRRAVYVTSDLGDHWTKHATDSTLVECFCQASLYRVAAADNCLGRDLLLFCNCAHNPRQRRDMTVRMSLDGGLTWPCALLLDHYHGMGYSCMTLLDPETLGIIYESSQGSEIFQALSLRELYDTHTKSKIL